MTAAFGTYTPNTVENAFRKLAHRLPSNYWGKRCASLLLGPSGGRQRKPRDIVVFGSQKVRLHPYDNICEKRVYATPQLWDREERATLEMFMKAHDGDMFYCVDVGANAGLYSLFARSVAHDNDQRFMAACIEPDSEMQSRLAFNIAASGAEHEMRIFPYAAAKDRTKLQFAQNRKSRGMGRVSDDGEISVQGAPLLEIIQSETNFQRIDVLKIDIEGHEFDVLNAFFTHAPETLFPSLIILETSHETGSTSAAALCKEQGYEYLLQTKMNAVLRKRSNNSSL